MVSTVTGNLNIGDGKKQLPAGTSQLHTYYTYLNLAVMLGSFWEI